MRLNQEFLYGREGVNKGALLAICGLIAAMSLAAFGCGDSSDEATASLTRDQYLAQGNAIFKEGTGRTRLGRLHHPLRKDDRRSRGAGSTLGGRAGDRGDHQGDGRSTGRRGSQPACWTSFNPAVLRRQRDGPEIRS